MTLFIISNWIACIVTSIFLCILLRRQRFLFVKPSILVILFFHLEIQWAATVQSAPIESYLPAPFSFALLVHGFPLIGLYVSLLIGRRDARIVWHRITNPQSISSRASNRAMCILIGCVVFVTIFYLSFVPFSKSGLFAMFSDPVSSGQAREDSLKLIDNTILKYSYSFMISAFAPLLAVLLARRFVQSVRQQQFIRSLTAVVALVGVLFVVSLTGARGHAANIIMTILFAWFLNKGLRMNPLRVTFAILAIVTLPTILTILREGKELSILLFWHYLTDGDGVFGRVFITPMEVGLWHVHYAQTIGYLGIAGVPRLASLFDVQPVNAPNFIGLIYGQSPLESINANVSYVFSYYSYFGLFSFIFSLVGLWLLDFAVLVYRRLDGSLLLPCVASVSIAGISFVSADYTTVLLTHGFGVLLILAQILNNICSWRARVYFKRGSKISPADHIGRIKIDNIV